MTDSREANSLVKDSLLRKENSVKKDGGRTKALFSLKNNQETRCMNERHPLLKKKGLVSKTVKTPATRGKKPP